MSSLPGPSEARIDRKSAEPIAIVGMDCIFPKARDLVSFWNNIVRSVDGIQKLEKPRCNPGAYGLPEVWGGSIEGLTEFDPEEFGIPPAEVEAGDPEHFLVLAVAHRALRDAQQGRAARLGRHEIGDGLGSPCGRGSSGIGTCQPPYLCGPTRAEVVVGHGGYIGNGSEHIYLRTDFLDQVVDLFTSLIPDASTAHWNDFRRKLVASLPRVDSDVVASAIPNLIAGRVANRLNLMGTSYTVDAACASSLIAVDSVVRDLRDGRCDVGIACGVHISQRLSLWFAFQALQMLSPSGRISPFSADADGLVVGEGVGAVVLKRLSDALHDEDRIYALIRGIGVASDGLGAGLFAPKAEGQALAIQRAYDACDLDPRAITLLEGHGTATNVGDTTEISVLHQIFGREGFPSVALGSVKSMIGHAMPAAGMAGLIKTALAVYHRILPPTINVRRVHPDLERSRIWVNTTVRPWISPLDKPRRAGVNAFGFGGINVHAILEEGPEEALGLTFTPRTSELFVLSAPSRDELAADVARWEKATVGLADQRLPDLCSSACQSFRASDAFRLAVVAATTSDLAARLSDVHLRLQRGEASHQNSEGVYFESQRNGGKVAVLFPGIGFAGLVGGYPTRLAELCLHFPEVRRTFDSLEGWSFGEESLYPTSHLLFPTALLDTETRSEIDKELNRPERASVVTGTAYYASWQLAEKVRIEPDAITGFSLGEGTSLLAAGVLKPEDAVRDTMVESPTWEEIGRKATELDLRWAAVSASGEQVEAVLREASGSVSIVMDVDPALVFICGEHRAVLEVLRTLEEQGLWGQVLPVIPILKPYFGAHTDHARVLEEDVRKYLWALPIRPPRYRLYSGTWAEPFPDDPDAFREMCLSSLSEPVRIRQTIERLHNDGHRVFVQLGSGGKMLPTIQHILGQREFVAVSIDVDYRGGLEQFHHMLGRLAALGVPLALQNLFAGRLCRPVYPNEHAQPTPTTRTLPLTPPHLHLPEASRQWFRRELQAAGTGDTSNHPTLSSDDLRKKELCPGLQGSVGAAFGLMDRFLEVQRQSDDADARILTEYLRTQQAVLGEFLREGIVTARGAAQVENIRGAFSECVAAVTDSRCEPDAKTSQGRFPLLGDVETYVPGRELKSRLVLNLAEHLFLNHHALLPVPDHLKPLEERLPTLPFTFEVEIIAEAAEALVPGLSVVSCEDLRAGTWLSLVDSRTLDLEISATCESDAVVAVEIKAGPNRVTAFQGKVVLAPALPTAPVGHEKRCDEQCPLTAEEFYARSPLFHGDMFHVIKRFRGMEGDTVSAEIVVSDPNRLFATPPERALVFDPVLIDALGQVVAYRAWLDKWLIFPTHVRRIQRFGPTPPPGTRVRCVMRYRKLNARQVEADIEVIEPGGKLLARVEGWRDWRIIHPSTVVEARSRPRELFIAKGWDAAPLAASCFRVTKDDLLDLGPDWVAKLYLRGGEVAKYAEQNDFAWLLGRVAAKDALRDWLRQHRGTQLHPLEVEIANRPDGSPIVIIPEHSGLAVSISHLEDQAIAAVVQGGRVGVDVVGLDPRGPEFERLTLSDEERSHLPGGTSEHLIWVNRAWAAKEAAAKAYGKGLADLTGFAIQRAAREDGTIEILARADRKILRVPTRVDDGRVYAVFACAE